MPLSLRIPPEIEKILNKAAANSGMTKSAFIIQTVKEKLGLVKNRSTLIRELAGWMSPEETRELRKALEDFDRIEEGDWK